MYRERMGETPRAARWPDALAYREAIQNPGAHLRDPELADAAVHNDRQQLPLAYAGRNAIVFRLEKQRQLWALRCFTTPEDPQQIPRAVRYALLQKHTRRLPGLFVPVRFLEHGIRVGASHYPVVAMGWATGEPLGEWVQKSRRNPAALRRLASTLETVRLALEEAGIAHGDWHHDNLLVSAGGARATLVDYDGLFVPELSGYPAPELGHRNYQHPVRSAIHFGVGLDRFACLSMRAALLGLAHDPGLWDRFGDGESVLFVRADFADPPSSALFGELYALAESAGDMELEATLVALAAACVDSSLALPAPSTEPPRPLALEPEETQKGAASPGARWWQGGPQPTVSPPAASAAPGFRYLDRLESPAASKEKETHRLTAALAVSALFCILPLQLPAKILFLPLLGVLFIQGMSAVAGSWSRRKLQGELNAEIAALEKAIDERRSHLEVAQNGPQSDVSERERFISEWLAAVPLIRVLNVPGISGQTVQALQNLAVETALDIAQLRHIPSLPSVQNAALRRWVEERRLEAAAEFRRRNAAAAGEAAMASALPAASVLPRDRAVLEEQLLALEQEKARLQEELRRFPDTSTRAYLGWLFGQKA